MRLACPRRDLPPAGEVAAMRSPLLGTPSTRSSLTGGLGGRCISSRTCGTMAETKSLSGELECRPHLTQEAFSMRKRRVAEPSWRSLRSCRGLRLRIDSP
jgi:hypothetical protein